METEKEDKIMDKKLQSDEKYARIQDLRPIDDIFFEALAEDPRVCQEILRTILEDNDNHLKRARFNASLITVKDSQSGDKFEDVLDLYVVYISEFDVFKEGKTIYHVEKILRETGTVVDDGLHEIFVNTAIDDGTTIADLMNCFTKKEVRNPKFPELSRRVTELKETPRGRSRMSTIKDELIYIGMAEGKEEQLVLNVKSIMENLSKSADEAMDILNVPAESREKYYSKLV